MTDYLSYEISTLLKQKNSKKSIEESLFDSLSYKLNNIVWKDYDYNEFFETIPVKNKLTKRDLDSLGKVNVYSATSDNYGIIGSTSIPAEFSVDSENSVYICFGDHTRTFSIIYNDFSVMDNVKVLRPKYKISKKSLLFIISSWKKSIPYLGYSRHWSLAKKSKIKIPVTKENEIDFKTMDNIISSLERNDIEKIKDYYENR